jgi:hypothetical protein
MMDICTIAAAAFLSLPPWLRPEPCGGSPQTRSVLADNSVNFYGTTPAQWTVTVDVHGKVIAASFNGKPLK